MNPTHKQMASQAVQAHGGRATFAEIKDYVRNHFDPLNEDSFNCSVNSCSVNLQSRVHYPENQKARVCLAGKGYDLFFKAGSGPTAVFVIYDPAVHGQWEIAEARRSGKAAERWVVREVGQASASEPQPLPPEPPRPRPAPAPRPQLGPDELGRMKRCLMDLIHEFDPGGEDESPGARISRLAYSGAIPRHVAKVMGMMVEYRNFLEHRHGVLSSAETETILSARRVIDEWSASRGYRTRLACCMTRDAG